MKSVINCISIKKLFESSKKCVNKAATSCVSVSNYTVFLLVILFNMLYNPQSRTRVQPRCEVLNAGFTASQCCLNGQNTGLTALFLEFSLTLPHKKMAVLKSVSLDCCTWPSAPVGFQTQPVPQRSPIPTEVPLCLTWNV